METSTAKELVLKNENNKLNCDAFIQIGMAPFNTVREADMEKIYFVKHNGVDVFLQLVDIMRLPFSAINSTITLPATGKLWHEWKDDWFGRYPNTLADTPLAVYYYKRKTD